MAVAPCPRIWREGKICMLSNFLSFLLWWSVLGLYSFEDLEFCFVCFYFPNMNSNFATLILYFILLLFSLNKLKLHFFFFFCYFLFAKFFSLFLILLKKHFRKFFQNDTFTSANLKRSKAILLLAITIKVLVIFIISFDSKSFECKAIQVQSPISIKLPYLYSRVGYLVQSCNLSPTTPTATP